MNLPRRCWRGSATKTRKHFAVFILFAFLVSGFALKMPFSPQAPEGDWSEPWYNDCEEVSIVMVDSFYNNRILTPIVAKREILRIIGIKEDAFGFSLNENANKIVDLVNNYLNSNWEAQIAEDPTIEEIKNEVDNGNPVLFLADGRKLNNKYFTTSHYHVFVISGYDDGKKVFMAQEAGTRHGHDYQYPYATIENAMHDYDPVDLARGRRVAIFTSLKVEKADELKATASPVLLTAPSAAPSKNKEVKKDVLPTILPMVSRENTEDNGLTRVIRDYWNNFIEWIKKIF